MLEHTQVGTQIKLIGCFELKMVGGLIGNKGAPRLIAIAGTKVIVATATIIVLEPDAINGHIVEMADGTREAQFTIVQNATCIVVGKDITQRECRRERPLFGIRTVTAIGSQCEISYILVF